MGEVNLVDMMIERAQEEHKRRAGEASFKQFATIDTGGVSTPVGALSKLSARPDNISSILTGQNEALNAIVSSGPGEQDTAVLERAREQLAGMIDRATSGELDFFSEPAPLSFADKWMRSFRGAMNPGQRARVKQANNIKSMELVQQFLPTLIGVDKELTRRKLEDDPLAAVKKSSLEAIIEQAKTEFQISQRPKVIRMFMEQGDGQEEAEFKADKLIGTEGFAGTESLEQKVAGLADDRAFHRKAGLSDEQSLALENVKLGLPAGTGSGINRIFQKYETFVTQEMIDEEEDIGQDRLGDFVIIRETLNPRGGERERREILGPGTESSRFLMTPDGVRLIGSQSGNVGGVLIDQSTGEALRPLALDIQDLRVQVASDNSKKRSELPIGVLNDLTDQGVAIGAAERALTRWVQLGRPDLGLVFSATFDRFKPQPGVEARAAIAAAVIPIRKFFSGAAVTPSEAEFAESLIARIDGPVAPNILQTSLLELINHSRRVRRRIIEDAKTNKLDTSGFDSELSSGELDIVDDLEQFLSGGSQQKTEDRRGSPGDTINDGPKFVVDPENGLQVVDQESD